MIPLDDQLEVHEAALWTRPGQEADARLVVKAKLEPMSGTACGPNISGS